MSHADEKYESNPSPDTGSVSFALLYFNDPANFGRCITTHEATERCSKDSINSPEYFNSHCNSLHGGDCNTRITVVSCSQDDDRSSDAKPNPTGIVASQSRNDQCACGLFEVYRVYSKFHALAREHDVRNCFESQCVPSACRSEVFREFVPPGRMRIPPIMLNTGNSRFQVLNNSRNT